MSRTHIQQRFADRGWWKLLILIPLLFLLWLLLSLTNNFIAFYLSARLSGYITTLQQWVIVANIAVSLYSPFLIFHDRKFVAEHTAWTPNILYVISFIPIVNVLIVSAYLIQRRQYNQQVTQ